jgi:hypothetical protein
MLLTAVGCEVDSRVARCGAGPETGGTVLAAFDLAAVRDITKRIPNMAPAPELERDGAAFVVVLQGPLKLPQSRFGPTSNGEVSNAVCVLSDDRVEFYVDVDLAGLR